MLTMQDVAARIGQTIKDNGMKKGDFLKQCGFGVNLLSQMAKSDDVSCSTIVTLADGLGCSVDFLLCRSDATHKTEVGVDSELTDDESDLLDFFRGMNRFDRREILVTAKRMYDAERGAGAESRDQAYQ